MSVNYKKVMGKLDDINNYLENLEKNTTKKTIFFSGSENYLGVNVKKRLVQAGHTVIDTDPKNYPVQAPNIDLIINFTFNYKKDFIKLSKRYNCPLISLIDNAIQESPKAEIPTELLKKVNFLVPHVFDAKVTRKDSLYQIIKNNETISLPGTLDIISLDKFVTVSLAKIYEILRKNGTRSTQEIFKYESIKFETMDVYNKMNAGFWE